MWYNLDVYKLAAHLLPPGLRKKKMFAFISILLYPFYLLAQSFRSYYKAATSRLKTNGQVMYIERVLNETYSLEYNEIYITDSESQQVNQAILYKDGNLTMTLYTEADDDILYLASGYQSYKEEDYIVNVPSFLESELDNIRNIVEYNRPAGRKYKINIYEYE